MWKRGGLISREKANGYQTPHVRVRSRDPPLCSMSEQPNTHVNYSLVIPRRIRIPESFKLNSDQQRTCEAAVLHTFVIDAIHGFSFAVPGRTCTQSTLLFHGFHMCEFTCLHICAVPLAILTVPSWASVGTWTVATTCVTPRMNFQLRSHEAIPCSAFFSALIL